jgi:hypothetical protein
MALTFADADNIPAWAVEAVSRVTAAGLFDLRAGGRFAPAEPVTAGEIAAILGRFIKYCETNCQ